LSAVPFTNTDAIRILDTINQRNLLQSTSSLIYTNTNNIRGITRRVSWYGSINLYTHIFYDRIKADYAELQLLEELNELKELYFNSKLSEKDRKMFDRFFIINNEKSKNSKYHLLDNSEEIQKYLKYEGWLMLISNHIKNHQHAYNLYVNKDCVEKAFREYKQNLGMHRIHTGSSKRFTNKSIVAFIALILNSHIHRVMSKSKLYSDYTRSKLLRHIARLDAFLDIDNKYYPKAITKKQKVILETFEIKIPNRYIINYFIKNIIK
jgi:hypothetical protein